MKRIDPHPVLPPDVAAARCAEDPDSIAIMLPDLLESFGITFAELLPDLRSGALVASAFNYDNPKDALANNAVYFTGGALISWMTVTGRRHPKRGRPQ